MRFLNGIPSEPLPDSSSCAWNIIRLEAVVSNPEKVSVATSSTVEPTVVAMEQVHGQDHMRAVHGLRRGTARTCAWRNSPRAVGLTLELRGIEGTLVLRPLPITGLELRQRRGGAKHEGQRSRRASEQRATPDQRNGGRVRPEREGALTRGSSAARCQREGGGVSDDERECEEDFRVHF